MRNFIEKIAHWLALDTEATIASVEYAGEGVSIGGLLVWFLGWKSPA